MPPQAWKSTEKTGLDRVKGLSNAVKTRKNVSWCFSLTLKKLGEVTTLGLLNTEIVEIYPLRRNEFDSGRCYLLLNPSYLS